MTLMHIFMHNAQSFPLKCSSLSLKLIFPDALHCLSVLRWERRKHGRSSAYNQDASQQKLLTVESGQRQKGCVMTAITGKKCWGGSHMDQWIWARSSTTNGVKVGLVSSLHLLPKHTPRFGGSGWRINCYWGVSFVYENKRLVPAGHAHMCVCEFVHGCPLGFDKAIRECLIHVSEEIKPVHTTAQRLEENFLLH